MPSFVYLIEELPLPGETIQPWTKIGYTKNPAEWRLDANLKRGNPRDLRFGAVYEFETEDEGRKAEKAAHSAFAAQRDRRNGSLCRGKPSMSGALPTASGIGLTTN